MLMLQEEINKNQKGGNNNRDSGLFGLDVPPKPEVFKCFRSYLLTRDNDDDDYYRHDDDFGDYEQNLSLSSLFQPTEEPVSPSPRIGREVWSTDHEGSQIR